MQIRVTARHLKLTGALTSYVQEKVEKLQKYFERIQQVQVVLAVEKRRHVAEIILHAARQIFRAQATGTDLYSAVDLVVDKVQIQLKKHKERLKEHKPDEFPLTAVSPEESVRPGTDWITVIRRVPVRPMMPEEAVRTMEQMGYHFWMFHNKQTHQINVLFRRLDYSYGLLQPVKGGKEKP